MTMDFSKCAHPSVCLSVGEVGCEREEERVLEIERERGETTRGLLYLSRSVDDCARVWMSVRACMRAIMRSGVDAVDLALKAPISNMRTTFSDCQERTVFRPRAM